MTRDDVMAIAIEAAWKKGASSVHAEAVVTSLALAGALKFDEPQRPDKIGILNANGDRHYLPRQAVLDALEAEGYKVEHPGARWPDKAVQGTAFESLCNAAEQSVVEIIGRVAVEHPLQWERHPSDDSFKRDVLGSANAQAVADALRLSGFRIVKDAGTVRA